MTASDEKVFAFDEYRLLAAERRLLCAGSAVTLAPKAFDLLLLLVRHNGQIVEKSALMKELWPDTFVEEANLNVHVSAIRKALGESAQRPRYIATIPGRGYRFTANLQSLVPKVPRSSSAKYPRYSEELRGTERGVDATAKPQLPNLLPRRTPRFAIAFATAAAVLLSGLVPLLYSRCAPHDPKPVVRSVPRSAEAQRYYVMGRHHWNKRSTEGLRKAIELFQKAIDEDPQYAPAFVGLADAYSMLGDHTGQTSGEYRQQAHAAAIQALRIDDQLAEAHATLGYLRMRNWEWGGVEHEFRRAIEIDPRYATAHQWYSIFLELHGRSNEAIAEAQRAQELDPLSPIINESLGSRLYFARRYDRAQQQLRRTIEIQPSFQGARETLSMVHLQTGRTGDALAASPSGYAFARAGQTAKARAALQHLDPVETARVHLALGERDLALQSLERAFAQHADHLVFIKVDPSWDGLRREPRFEEVVRRVGL